MGRAESGLPDIGGVASFDPVAADAAASDLLNERQGHDVFKKLWPQINPRIQIEHGEKIGLGTSRYRLVR